MQRSGGRNAAQTCAVTKNWLVVNHDAMINTQLYSTFPYPLGKKTSHYHTVRFPLPTAVFPLATATTANP